jgi:CubicO group peptidase (beta-lactamase class C family)/D-alanyl-D-alanine dipeptidase
VRRPRARGAALAAAVLALAAAAFRGQDAAPAPPSADPYAAALAKLDAFAAAEAADKKLPALAVAIVEGDRILWRKDFGDADSEAKIPASADTVYRVGSVSKLFTDIGVMQLVEHGELDLDVPIQKILPDFRPKNPFGSFLTLRELMSHRSGLVREPPVGHYFDPTEPTLAATVASLNDTELVYPPGTHTKYSNAGIAVVGYVLERGAGEPFARYLKRAVLEPMGMSSSAFEPEAAWKPHLAKARMWGYDTRDFPAPTFELGIAPAGSLYTTTTDLTRFLRVLFAGGATSGGGRILRKETLDRMWALPAGQKAGYGIGFRIGEIAGHRAVGHNGAIYGFATALAALPDDKLGAVAVATRDAANSVTNRVVQEAMRLLLAARAGAPLPEVATTEPLEASRARELAGRYAAGNDSLDLTEQFGELDALGGDGGERLLLRASGGALVADGPLGFGQRFEPVADGVRTGEKTFARVPDVKPAGPQERFEPFLGEYGWDHDILYILERDGRLTALIEWFEYDPLTEVSGDVFRFPDRGLYDHEPLVFTRDAAGRVSGVRVGPVLFPRRNVGPEAGKVFQIRPVRPVEELRPEALAATPPPQPPGLRKPDLVELVTLDPSIRLDVRYATENNFLGVPLYTQARAFLQRPAAEALLRAHRNLARRGYGLLIHDAYRPWAVTKLFWDATPEDKHIFVADPATGSRHNRGCAVDLTLYELGTGAPLVMTGGYDEMSDRSFAAYPAGTSLQRWQRNVLRRAMEAEGFAVYEWEWWHFDYKDWKSYPVANVPFEKLR